jgi:hypothetical protein
MKMKQKVIGAAIGAMGLAGLSGSAHALSVTPPGSFAGIDLASPLPEGVYFVDIGSVGAFRYGGDHVGYGGYYSNGGGHASSLNYNIPALVWSTPWTLLGGRIEALAALPVAEVGITANGTSNFSGASLYNPFLGLSWNFAFGNGFSVSYSPGVYLPMTGGSLDSATTNFICNRTYGVVCGVQNAPLNQTTFDQKLALAYHNNGWNATALLEYGLVGNNGDFRALNVGGAPANLTWAFGYSRQFFMGDYFNYDLALTKTMGKWEIGVVGFGSVDTSSTVLQQTNGIYPACPLSVSWINGSGLIRGAQCGKASQFALGGLVGYNFGPVITQVVVSSDVASTGYSTRDTRGTLHVIIPLWAPEAPKAVAAKY